jgi:F420-non-reducing hydrogenase large subunit
MPTIKIEPITRLEGHLSVNIELTDEGKVKDVLARVTLTRFFEKFLEGRLMEHAPRIVPRICGICPEAHHLASIKAVEDAWDITPPTPALKLRELLLQGKMISSHIIHFYALAAPDFVFGPFADPAVRNLVGIVQHLPDEAKATIAGMRFGQDICHTIGGRAVHPVTALPGGQSIPFSEEDRDEYLKRIDEVIEFSKFSLELGKKVTNDYIDVALKVGILPTYYVGMANNGVHTYFDGTVRVMDPEGNIAADFDTRDYKDYMGEYITDHSYTSHVFYKPAGYPQGIWRANTLARINVVDKMETPLAQKELEIFRETLGRPCHATFAYHWARLIELLESAEKAKILLEDPDIVSTDVKLADVEPKEGEGVGIIEAPRGTLVHNYWSDADGLIAKANLIVATNHNLGAIEVGLKQMAVNVFEKGIVNELKLPEPMVKT